MMYRSRWDILNEHLFSPSCEINDNSNKKQDKINDFNSIIKELAKTIQRVRIILEKRNDLVKDKEIVETVKLNDNIRIIIEQCLEEIEQLKKIVVLEEELWNKEKIDKNKKLDDSEKNTIEYLKIKNVINSCESNIQNKYEIIKLLFCHIQECETIFLYVDSNNIVVNKNRMNLLEIKSATNSDFDFNSNLSSTQTIISLPDINKIPLIDMEIGLKQQDELDLILNNMKDLTMCAEEMANKIKPANLGQGETIVNMTNDIEENNIMLTNRNREMLNILKKIRDPKKFCVNIIFIFVFLGSVGLIINIIANRIYKK